MVSEPVDTELDRPSHPARQSEASLTAAAVRCPDVGQLNPSSTSKFHTTFNDGAVETGLPTLKAADEGTDEAVRKVVLRASHRRYPELDLGDRDGKVPLVVERDLQEVGFYSSVRRWSGVIVRSGFRGSEDNGVEGVRNTVCPWVALGN